MAIISQITLFDYSEIEVLGDLERLVLALDGIDDEKLMLRLEEKRGKGRNAYPVRVMWNLLIAMIVFDHKSVASFRRELSRNYQLRKLCLLPEGDGRKHLVPPAGVFSRFFKSLYGEIEEVTQIFNDQVEQLSNLLPGLGGMLAGDGKYIDSLARRKPNQDQSATDDRSENDAERSTKEYHCVDAQGRPKVKTEYHFGFKTHLICDVETELPLAFSVTAANADERKQMTALLKTLSERHPGIISNAECCILDRGYDSTEMIKIIKQMGIAPVIDIRNSWRSGEATKQYRDTNIVYDYRGNVYYVEYDGTLVKMKYEGYDKQKNCLRYSHKGKKYRITISYDERIFLPIARDSAKFKRLYKGRTAVERVNGRLDRDYMFEEHYIRGLNKMTLMVALSFIVMDGMAVGKLRSGRTMLRSLKNTA